MFLARAVIQREEALLRWILDSCSLCRLAFVLAKVKGHDQVEWAWYGFIFGLFGLLAAVGLPDHRVAPDTSTEPCPACGETLAKGYSKCRNCNEALMWHEGTPYSGSESEVRKQLSELAEATRQQLLKETEEKLRLEIELSLRTAHIKSERSHFWLADLCALLAAGGPAVTVLIFLFEAAVTTTGVADSQDGLLICVFLVCAVISIVAFIDLENERRTGGVRGCCRWRNMFRRKLMGSDRLPNSTEPKQDPTSDESNHAG